MFRVLLALLLTIAPMARPASDTKSGPVGDGNDEWQCDGNPGEHCNPKL
jgi:hypothetical protein